MFSISMTPNRSNPSEKADSNNAKNDKYRQHICAAVGEASLFGFPSPSLFAFPRPQIETLPRMRYLFMCDIQMCDVSVTADVLPLWEP